jgi:hypothetical protein
MGYTRRLANFRRFRAELSVPLAAIELGFNGRWELTERDADLLVRVTDGDVMWQKERLLNILIKRLPPECEYIAWLDSDVILRDLKWPEQTVEKLKTVPLVQLFSELRYLGQDENYQVGSPCLPSTAAAVLGGRLPAEVFQNNPQSGFPPARGMALAARRDLLERHGFYDSCVIGGGDTALLYAAYGVPKVLIEKWQMHRAQGNRYLRWARDFHRDVKGQVASLEGEINHLWHGELDDRHYTSRHIELVPHRFDPYVDIRPGADGAWRWASDKPALHALLREYFQRRQEDGRR